MTSVTAAPKSILQGCELRCGPLGVHRMCLGCFESDSKKFFSTPSYRYFSVVIDIFLSLPVRVKNRVFGGA